MYTRTDSPLLYYVHVHVPKDIIKVSAVEVTVFIDGADKLN